MKKSILLILYCLFIVACGGDAEVTNILIDLRADSNSTYTIDNSANYDETDLTIIGSSNTVTINSELNLFRVPGSNNLITITNVFQIEDCVVEGNDNTLILPNGFNISCDITGLGNTGF